MIINLTQHKASPDQVKAGVMDLSVDDREQLQHLLTFHDTPSASDLKARAREVASLADRQYHADGICPPRVAMIGGAPYFMPFLERALRVVSIQPVYAFSKRESIEAPGPDGAVVKRTVFKHMGFVKP